MKRTSGNRRPVVGVAPNPQAADAQGLRLLARMIARRLSPRDTALSEGRGNVERRMAGGDTLWTAVQPEGMADG